MPLSFFVAMLASKMRVGLNRNLTAFGLSALEAHAVRRGFLWSNQKSVPTPQKKRAKVSRDTIDPPLEVKTLDITPSHCDDHSMLGCHYAVDFATLGQASANTPRTTLPPPYLTPLILLSTHPFGNVLNTSMLTRRHLNLCNFGPKLVFDTRLGTCPTLRHLPPVSGGVQHSPALNESMHATVLSPFPFL